MLTPPTGDRARTHEFRGATDALKHDRPCQHDITKIVLLFVVHLLCIDILKQSVIYTPLSLCTSGVLALIILSLDECAHAYIAT